MNYDMIRIDTADTTVNINEQINIAKNGGAYTLSTLCLNKNLCIEAQNILVTDYDVYVRIALSCNPVLCYTTQFLLVKDIDYTVRWNLSQNKHLLDDIQLMLADEFGDDIKWPGPKTKAYLAMKKVLDK